jgi:hypothetical protein
VPLSLVPANGKRTAASYLKRSNRIVRAIESASDSETATEK